MKRLGLLIALLAAGFAAPAQAATVGLADGTVTIIPSRAAGDGLTVSGDPAALTVDGNAVVAGDGCTASGRRVTCVPAGCEAGQPCVQPIRRPVARLGEQSDLLGGALRGTLDVDASLGGGSDTYALRTEAGTSVVRGGDGADSLTGGPAAERLEGGDGADSLSGGPGPDVVDGGPGDDTVTGTASDSPGDGADVYRGGPGSDLITFRRLREPLRVTLDGIADDGTEGEGDLVDVDFERVWGGEGPDLLVGAAGPEGLYGGGGADRLLGGGGADLLEGEAGDDVLSGDGRDDPGGAPDGADYVAGGAGKDVLDGGAAVDGYNGGDDDDRIVSRDPVISFAPVDENVLCGLGIDTAVIDWNDGARSDCERIERGPTPAGYGPSPSRGPAPVGRGRGPETPLGVPVVLAGQVILPVFCAADVVGRCRARATVTAIVGRRAGGRRPRHVAIGRVSSLVPAGATSVSVPVKAAGRELVRRLRSVRARADLRLSFTGAAPARFARPLRIRGAGLVVPPAAAPSPRAEARR